MLISLKTLIDKLEEDKELKPLLSDTLGAAGISCLVLELYQGSIGAAVTCGHSGHKSAPFMAVLSPAAKGLLPMAVNVASLFWRTGLIRLKKSSFLSIMELWQERGCDNLTAIHS